MSSVAILKTSNAEMALTKYYLSMVRRNDRDTDPYDKVWWAHAYANKYFEMCLQVLATHYPENERAQFIQRHRKRISDLHKHIERILARKPLVDAAALVREGIIPGKSMGMLLNEAEALAINMDSSNAAEVIAKLKQSAHWTKDLAH